MTKEWERAVRSGAVDELERLLSRGADIDALDRHGQTALMLAVADGNVPVVEWLVRQGADLDRTAKFGLSALMMAVIRDHAAVVRILVAAGASLAVRGTGAPGFNGRTALDLAIARGNREAIAALEAAAGRRRAAEAHFQTVESLVAARSWLTFVPLEPKDTAGLRRRSIRIHVRDHKRRELPPARRTLEMHYGRFVVSQSRPGAEEARRLALDVSYGRAPGEVRIAGHAGRVYQLGPEPPTDDIDGRSPAVVTWHDAGMLHLVASTELSADELIRIAASLYR